MRRVLILLAMVYPTLWAGQINIGTRTAEVVEPSNLVNAGLFLFFHGGGEQATTYASLWKNTGDFTKDWLIVCPQSKSTLWSASSDGVFIDDLMDELAQRYILDGQRLVCGGFSSGAVFCYEIGLKRHKDIFDTLFIAEGMLNTSVNTATANSAKIEMVHSTNDSVFPYSGAVNDKDSLLSKQYTVTLTTDSIDHDIGNVFIDKVVGKYIRDHGSSTPSLSQDGTDTNTISPSSVVPTGMVRGNFGGRSNMLSNQSGGCFLKF